MPCARSTFGSVTQPLQFTQCVRLVCGATMPGKAPANSPSWEVSTELKDAEVNDWQPVLGCSASSKPADWYAVALAGLSGVLAYMYADARTHVHAVTEQPAGLSAFMRSKYASTPLIAWSSPVITTAAFRPRGR